MPTRAFRRLAWTMVAGTYALMVLGGMTKAYGAGLACPDWPLCYGKLIPQLDFLVFLEWFHRLVALVVGVLALVTTAAALRLPGDRSPWVRGCLVSLGILPVQAVFGGLTVFTNLNAVVDASHLALGTAFFATWVVLAVSASMSEPSRRQLTVRFVTVPLVAAVATYVTMILGSYMKAAGGGLACPDWPLCRGQLVPLEGGLVLAQFVHRLAALVAGLAVFYTAYFMFRRARGVPTLTVPAGIASGLLVIQVLLGGVAVLQALPPPVTVAHLAVAAALVGTLVALTTAAYRLSAAGSVTGAVEPAPGAGAPGPRPLRAVLLDYLLLMKPRILLLILAGGLAAMWLAERGLPPLGLTAFTMLGLLLSGGGANAVNMWYDRDIDAVMARTRRRPLPAGRLQPGQALVFGILAAVAGVLVLAVAVNLLAAALALAGFLYYVLVYTMWLKRTTAQNIVIGGACGALAPLVGWAAVTGTVGAAALVLFLVVFLWTPPHFWALALYRNEDYRRAGVPMLPVVRGESHTKWQILAYALLVVPASLLLYLTGIVGPAYLWVALVLGVWFVSGCVALLRERLPSQVWARRVFRWSIVYLAALFAAMVADVRP